MLPQAKEIVDAMSVKMKDAVDYLEEEIRSGNHEAKPLNDSDSMFSVEINK